MTETTLQAETPATTPLAQTDAAPQAEAPATQVEATPETPETKDEQPRDPEGKFLPKNPRVQRLVETIQDLTRTKHETAREVARLKSEAEALRQQLEAQPQIDPADFEAQQAHSVRKAIKAEKYEDTVSRVRQLEAQSSAATGQIVQAQAAALQEQIPDIGNIFLGPQQGGPLVSPLMAEAIARTENGALVAYHLMKNPHEAQRLYTADPYTTALEIGRISAQVKPATPVRRVSQAPQPVQTVSGSPGNPAPDIASLSFKDYERIRNEQDLARR